MSSIIHNESQADYKSNKDNKPEFILIVNCVFNVPLMLISIIGNALVLAAILRTPSLRSPSNVFLCSLALSDLLVGLVVQPVYIVTSFNIVFHSSLMFTCQMTTVFACGVSLWAMTTVSVDRFLALHYHMRYPSLMTTKRAVYSSTGIWLLNIALSCVRVFNLEAYHLIIVVDVVICLLVSSFFYILIYRIVRQHQLQIHVQQQAVQNSNAEHNLNIVQSKKSAINTFIYYICMFLCYSPSLIFIMLNINTSSERLLVVRRILWILGSTVAYANSSINPLLFCWRICELRKAVLKILRNIFLRQTAD